MSDSKASAAQAQAQAQAAEDGAKQRGRSTSVSAFNTYTDKTAIPNSMQDGTENPASVMKANLTGSPVKELTRREKEDALNNMGLLSDLFTFRWMTQPASSAKIAGIVIVGYINWRLFTPHTANPFEPFIFLSHRVSIAQVMATDPSLAFKGDLVRYQKGYKDILFLLFYVVVFSCLRQTTTLYFFKPFAAWWGIKNERKRERFMEQGYAFLYWGAAGLYGLYVMSFQESWWMNFEHLWIKYPHWQMRAELKAYYLLQFSYWTQQALIMLLRLEAPRKDYYELVAHHLVTLWLIGWSYLVNLTQIGTTVFVCMDIPDAWLAIAKGCSYLDLNLMATTVFGVFMFVWTYFRIYTSARTLWSVWYQFDLIPNYTREWNPTRGWWLAPWMRYQIFAPLGLLLILNLFWYYLMWRVLIRAIRGHISDEREDGEYDDDEQEAAATAAKMKEGKVAEEKAKVEEMTKEKGQ